MNIIYPSELRKTFTNRKLELKLFEHARNQIGKGLPFNVSIFGQRRIGKTLLIKEFIWQHKTARDFVPVYLDFQTICTNPEDFAVAYMGWVCYWFFRRGAGSAEDFLSLTRLLKATGDDPFVRNKLLDLSTELNQSRRNRTLLLHAAFSFPEELARHRKKKMLVFIDEFQEIIRLTRYKDAGNTLGIFRNVIQASNTAYVLSGSLVSVMADLITNAKSPLFGQFQQHKIEPFSKEDTVALAQKILEKPDGDVLQAIYRYSAGYPYYITQIAQRLKTLCQLQEVALSPDLVKQAFLIEMLSPRGAINQHCEYVYSLSLEKARYYSVLKSLLSVLAAEDGLTQTQAAKKLKIPQGQVRNYLQALVKLDLLCEQEGSYFYLDPVLRAWVAYQEQGVVLAEFPRKEDLLELLAKLDEKFQRASFELGLAKEAEVKLLIGKMAGKRFPGSFFGVSRPVILPVFHEIETYRSQDGQTEIDALCRNSELMAVEIKWMNQPASRKEVEKFQAKTKKLGLRIRYVWFISKSGFTPEAMRYAKKHKMLCSTQEDLKEIQKAAVKKD